MFYKKKAKVYLHGTHTPTMKMKKFIGDMISHLILGMVEVIGNIICQLMIGVIELVILLSAVFMALAFLLVSFSLWWKGSTILTMMIVIPLLVVTIRTNKRWNIKSVDGTCILDILIGVELSFIFVIILF